MGKQLPFLPLVPGTQQSVERGKASGTLMEQGNFASTFWCQVCRWSSWLTFQLKMVYSQKVKILRNRHINPRIMYIKHWNRWNLSSSRRPMKMVSCTLAYQLSLFQRILPPPLPNSKSNEMCVPFQVFEMIYHPILFTHKALKSTNSELQTFYPVSAMPKIHHGWKSCKVSPRFFCFPKKEGEKSIFFAKKQDEKEFKL